MLLTFLKGIGTGGGLIIAIGAQNAFVLSQGVRKNHVLPIVLICCFCDMILIGVGVSGTGRLIAGSSLLTSVATIGGAAFLLFYGLRSFISAFNGGQLETNGSDYRTLKSAVTATLAVTLLNPHLYLDTVVLMGSISSGFPESGRYLFGAGAITASFIWFFSLGFGGGLLAPLFRKPLAWRILDSFVGITMWAIACSLLLPD